MKPFQGSIYKKLVICFLLVSLIPLLVSALISYNRSKASLKQQTLDSINLIADDRMDSISRYLNSTYRALQSLSTNPKAAWVMQEFAAMAERGLPQEDIPQYTINKRIVSYHLGAFGQVPIYLFNGDRELVYTADGNGSLAGVDNELGKGTAPFINATLLDAVNKTWETGEVATSKVSRVNGQASIYVAIRFNNSAKIPGVMAFRIGADKFKPFTERFLGLHDTGELMLWYRDGENNYSVGSPRHMEKVLLPVDNSIGQKLLTPNVPKNGDGVEIDYRGKKVLAAWRHIDSLGLAMLVKIDTNEVYAIVSSDRNLALLVAALTIACVYLISVLIARRVAAPIVTLTEQAKRIADGDFSGRVPVTSNDEIGKLSESFQSMSDSLRKAISDINRKNQQLAQGNALKSEFLANMSHEIRTPMNAIMGMTEFLQATKLNGEQKELVDVIGHSGRSLLILINDILDLSKVEAGKLHLEQQPFDFTAWINEIGDATRINTKHKGLNFSLTVAEDLPRYLISDPVRLGQCVNNLISNALKFTERGSIDIEACKTINKKGKTHLKISVRDTGIGIAEDQQQKIFHKFYQADGSTTRIYGGTGLGTTITKRLVEIMGGEVGLESSVGKGSLFWLSIPLLAAKTGEIILNPDQSNLFHDLNYANKTANLDIPTLLARKYETEKPQRQEKKLLLVEDNPVNQIVALGFLKRFGYSSVDIAENGEEALQSINDANYDLVFMDCQMPIMDGFAATRKIRSMECDKSGTPVIAMTACTMKGDREKCLAAGMNDYLSKPLSAKGLQSILQQYLPDAEIETESETEPDPA
ncbi:ATP-binding protein [Teredinibacter sp. KSP-S5-2]|uniref:ATP-binding protein n=1 Tax=Teredinibacter sp. KSP-S5-2 TaxID=3034506 RepID=UPI0029351DE9|nr:ATP-binding protein [Teredinibacter sp. KSP-S5-2]WNO08903.1 ATP-binding protein [Teredinibacter sp. KSP-S5-2]